MFLTFVITLFGFITLFNWLHIYKINKLGFHTINENGIKIPVKYKINPFIKFAGMVLCLPPTGIIIFIIIIINKLNEK